MFNIRHFNTLAHSYPITVVAAAVAVVAVVAAAAAAAAIGPSNAQHCRVMSTRRSSRHRPKILQNRVEQLRRIEGKCEGEVNDAFEPGWGCVLTNIVSSQGMLLMLIHVSLPLVRMLNFVLFDQLHLLVPSFA